MEDEDLLSFALDHVRERKAPGELVDGLEPVSGCLPRPSLSSIPTPCPPLLRHAQQLAFNSLEGGITR